MIQKQRQPSVRTSGSGSGVRSDGSVKGGGIRGGGSMRNVKWETPGSSTSVSVPAARPSVSNVGCLACKPKRNVALDANFTPYNVYGNVLTW